MEGGIYPLFLIVIIITIISNTLNNNNNNNNIELLRPIEVEDS